jgi:hypothetical protein
MPINISNHIRERPPFGQSGIDHLDSALDFLFPRRVHSRISARLTTFQKSSGQLQLFALSEPQRFLSDFG